jgi:NADH-quinone oxidoreductase subunit L
MENTLISLVVLLPLGGAAALLAFGKRVGEPWAGIVATATMTASFCLALTAALDYFGGHAEPVVVTWFDWLPALGVEAEFLWDPLAALMALVVTGVGAVIHLYSIGYMKHDAGYGRFFAYMNLFGASMLILVLASNFAVLFVGWEMVGLCSYLLISFWFDRPTAAVAGKKAFVVNRIGDAGFLVGLMLVFSTFGTLDFASVFEAAPAELSTGLATAITILLLVGATGKSAQLPLYVWLPDAMEGPTPVSALIHAATMVTAGVYMVARTGALFELAPVSAGIVAVVGAATALYAATIALGQRDIKRVLAYSTISQIGYMFMAVGAAAYVAGVFHLMTHAFFKALLFLGAGSVIHALGGEQDMRRMGGLARLMPLTFGTMVVAWLAISGIPPFAGFWSKDEILAAMFERGGLWTVLWGVGLVTALITAYYMSRLIYLTFFGERRWPEGVRPHESGPAMGVPLVVLGVASLAGGLLNTAWKPAVEHFLEPAFEGVTPASLPEGITLLVLATISAGVGLVGIVAASDIYLRRKAAREEGPVWDLLRSGYRVDDLYARVFVDRGGALVRFTAVTLDEKGVDGAVNGVARLTGWVGSRMRPLQTGFVRSYGLFVLGGAVALLAWFLSRGVF